MNKDKDRSGIVLGVVMAWLVFSWVVLFGFVSGCTTTPSCSDNPRNMQCMSAEQLERELNR